MNHPEVVDRLAILNAAHPRKLNEGLRHPSQLARSWYFFYFALPDLPEHHVRAKDWEFFQHFLHDAQPPYTEQETDRYIEAWSQPGAAGAMIDYYRAAVRPPKRTKTELHPISAPTLVIWGEKDRYLGPNLAEPTARTSPTSTASSACPTRRIGSTTTRPSASHNCSSTSSPPPGQPNTAERRRRLANRLGTEGMEAARSEALPSGTARARRRTTRGRGIASRLDRSSSAGRSGVQSPRTTFRHLARRRTCRRFA